MSEASNDRRRPRSLSAETKWEIFLQITAGEISQAEAARKWQVDVSTVIGIRRTVKDAAMIAHLILGFAIQLGGEREITDADREAFRKAIQEMDLSQFPATAAVKRARWRPTTVDQEFAFALEMVLDGLGQLRAQPTLTPG